MRRSPLAVRQLDTAIKSTSTLNPIRFFSMSTGRMSDEDAKFNEEVKATEKWFSSPRFAEIRRPYTAASVVEKRGTLPVIYPCDYQARKLWDLLGTYAADKKPLLTMGAIDPVQMTQMAPHQEVLYVSGWACSSVLASGKFSPDAI
jgi:isocitrate lyase